MRSRLSDGPVLGLATLALAGCGGSASPPASNCLVRFSTALNTTFNCTGLSAAFDTASNRSTATLTASGNSGFKTRVNLSFAGDLRAATFASTGADAAGTVQVASGFDHVWNCTINSGDPNNASYTLTISDPGTRTATAAGATCAGTKGTLVASYPGISSGGNNVGTADVNITLQG